MFVKTQLFDQCVTLGTPEELKDSKEAVRRGILITKNAVYLVHYEDTLETLYEMLDCRTIDIIARYVQHIPVNIVCDDEGLLVEGNFFTAIATDEREMLAGNILICGNDYSENLADIPVAFFTAIGACMASTGGLDERLADFVLRYQIFDDSEGEEAEA